MWTYVACWSDYQWCKYSVVGEGAVSADAAVVESSEEWDVPSPLELVELQHWYDAAACAYADLGA